MTDHQEPLLTIARDLVLVADHGPELVLQITGTPIPQGSLNKNRYGSQYYDNAATLTPWRANITAATRHAIAFEHRGIETPIYDRGTAVGVWAVFTFTRPAGHYGTGRNAGTLKDSAPMHHVVKPDSDKLIRACLDALKDAGLMKDDCQAVIARGEKTYAYPHHTHPDALSVPGAVIRIRPLIPNARPDVDPRYGVYGRTPTQHTTHSQKADTR